jgi:hypothetical protein
MDDAAAGDAPPPGGRVKRHAAAASVAAAVAAANRRRPQHAASVHASSGAGAGGSGGGGGERRPAHGSFSLTHGAHALPAPAFPFAGLPHALPMPLHAAWLAHHATPPPARKQSVPGAKKAKLVEGGDGKLASQRPTNNQLTCVACVACRLWRERPPAVAARAPSCFALCAAPRRRAPRRRAPMCRAAAAAARTPPRHSDDRALMPVPVPLLFLLPNCTGIAWTSCGSTTRTRCSRPCARRCRPARTSARP